MAIERKDVKVYLDPEIHAALKVICSHKDVGLAEYIEALVAPHIKAFVHDVNVMADEFRRSGISREGPGLPGSGGE